MIRRAGLLLFPAIFAALLLLPPPEGMTPGAWRTAALGLLMASWWVTESIPIPATALLPVVLLPTLGVGTIAETTAPYANPVVFLFMGGFMLALALERCGLHRRLALRLLRLTGTRPANLVGGFMLATGFISLWVSNTATVVMMLPIAAAIITLADAERGARPGPRQENLAPALYLGIAYAASIGGMGTLIGTPPNALLAGFMAESYGVRIGFSQWLVFALPLVVAALPLAWLLLTRLAFPLEHEEIGRGRATIGRELAALGPLSRAELTVGLVGAAVAAALIAQPLLERVLPRLSDTAITLGGALLLFVIPTDWRRGEFALDWRQAERLPWAVLILFGGGLSLAAAVQSTGLAGWIGHVVARLGSLPPVVVVVAATAMVVALTELASNTATAAAFLPVAASTAAGMGADPLLLAVPTAIGASCAFMLPVSTPPNALVFGAGRVTIPQMVRAGAGLNLVMLVLTTIALFTVGRLAFGAGLGR